MDPKITKIGPKSLPNIEFSCLGIADWRFRGPIWIVSRFGRFWVAFSDQLGGPGGAFWEDFGGLGKVLGAKALQQSNFEIGPISMARRNARSD